MNGGLREAGTEGGCESEKGKTVFLFLCDVFECQDQTRAPWPKTERKSIFILPAAR